MLVVKASHRLSICDFKPCQYRLCIGRLRVGPFSKGGLAGYVLRNWGSVGRKDRALPSFQVVNVRQFVALDRNMAIAAKGDAVGGLKGELGIVLDRHYVVRVEVPHVTATDTLLAEKPEHGVPPALILWSFTKTHWEALQNKRTAPRSRPTIPRLWI